jgi:uncharacterized Zn-binding protein involved in type VI secretion
MVPHGGGPILPPGAPTVFIAGMPAARVGDMATCVGPPDAVAMGSTGVFIAGKPAARLGDPTVHGGVIVVGCPTVLIGEVGGGGAGSVQGMTMSAARKAGAPFTRTGCDGKLSAPKRGTSSDRGRPRRKARPAGKRRTWPRAVSFKASRAKFGDGIRRVVAGARYLLGGAPAASTPEKEKILRQALQDQKKMLEAKKAELDRWDAPAKRNFTKWFGSSDEAARQKIRSRIDKSLELNAKYDVKNFKEAPPWKRDPYAFVFPTDKERRIYLGDPFHKAPATGQDSKAGILAHEMSHFRGVGDTKDHAYGVENSKRLAQKYPQRALENADSFEYYLENVP